MFDTIFIGTSGLLGHAKGLRIVGNNLSNVNTPGFKGSQLNFGPVFSTNAQVTVRDSASSSLGQGLTTLGSTINFKNGEPQLTDLPTNARIEGEGFFTVKRDDKILYTRLGDFAFDRNENFLLNSNEDRVQALDEKGKLVDVSLEKFNFSPAKATEQFNIDGNLKNTDQTGAEVKITNGELFDAFGKKHLFDIEIKEKSGDKFDIILKPKETGAFFSTSTVEIDFPAGGFSVSPQFFSTSFTPLGSKRSINLNIYLNSLRSSSAESSVVIKNRDGYEVGKRTGQTLKEDGNFEITYSNGQKLPGPSLAMAKFNSVQDLEQVGNSAFSLKDGKTVDYGLAGSSGIGNLVTNVVEASNVNLVEEFGRLILMQRGYQASSHVISTSNEMIQQLFDMKGNR